MLSNELIEKALALTWKVNLDISDAVFFMYLFSPEFMDKYEWWYYTESESRWTLFFRKFWIACREYQSWNLKPIISLLEKI